MGVEVVWTAKGTNTKKVNNYPRTINGLGDTFASNLFGIVSNAIRSAPDSARTWTLLLWKSFRVSKVTASPYIPLQRERELTLLTVINIYQNVSQDHDKNFKVSNDTQDIIF